MNKKKQHGIGSKSIYLTPMHHFKTIAILPLKKLLYFTNTLKMHCTYHQGPTAVSQLTRGRTNSWSKRLGHFVFQVRKM